MTEPPQDPKEDMVGYSLREIFAVHRSFSGVFPRFSGATVLLRRKPMVGNSDVRCFLHGQSLRVYLLDGR